MSIQIKRAPWAILTLLNPMTNKYKIYLSEWTDFEIQYLSFFLNVRMLLLMTDMQFHSTMITSYHCPGIKFYSQVNLRYMVPDTRD